MFPLPSKDSFSGVSSNMSDLAEIQSKNWDIVPKALLIHPIGLHWNTCHIIWHIECYCYVAWQWIYHYLAWQWKVWNWYPSVGLGVDGRLICRYTYRYSWWENGGVVLLWYTDNIRLSHSPLPSLSFDTDDSIQQHPNPVKHWTCETRNYISSHCLPDSTSLGSMGNSLGHLLITVASYQPCMSETVAANRPFGPILLAFLPR